MGSRGSNPSVSPAKEKLITITDEKMTRFMISLDEGVSLVIKAFEDMVGGEIYVKKIPSMSNRNLLKQLHQGVEIKFTGIRPGEKLHEQMIGEQDAPYAYEYSDYYKIVPNIFDWANDPERIKDGKNILQNLYTQVKVIQIG